MKKIIVRCPLCSSDKVYERFSHKEYYKIRELVHGIPEIDLTVDHIDGEVLTDDVFYCDECDTLFDIPVTEEVEVADVLDK